MESFCPINYLNRFYLRPITTQPVFRKETNSTFKKIHLAIFNRKKSREIVVQTFAVIIEIKQSSK